MRVSKLRNIAGINVFQETARAKDTKISEFFVTLRVILVLEDADR